MPKEILRITSGGSVDDGKSTILARLLLDTGSVYEDQLAGIDTRRVDVTTIADLLDGLQSEREQGITIDVAHRFFESKIRRYHICDSPGHEQYTRNMVTAASQAEAFLLVLEAASPVKSQALKHLKIAALLGIRQIIVAINKMDLVRHNQRAFMKREAEILALLAQHMFTSSAIIPVSGLHGTNIVKRHQKMGWWNGPTLLEALDDLATVPPVQGEAICSIQDVRRIPGGGRRYFASLISGRIKSGTLLYKAGHHTPAAVTTFLSSGSKIPEVSAPAEVCLELNKHIDLERGDLLSSDTRVRVTDRLEANLVWLNPSPGHLGRPLGFRLGHASVAATITRAWSLDDSLNNTSGEIKEITENSISRVTIELARKLALTDHADLAELGRFVMVDRYSGETLAAGTVIKESRGSSNITPHNFTLTNSDFESLTGVRGQVFWFTGLSGSGKSTIVNEVSRELHQKKIPHSILDGDTLRKGLTKGLGFSEADRIENVRLTAEVAKLMADSGLVVLVSLISPYQADRQNARLIIGGHRFFEVFVDTPIDVCEMRDPKGLYEKARSGELPQFTGVSSPYERPISPEMRLEGTRPLSELKKKVISLLVR